MKRRAARRLMIAGLLGAMILALSGAGASVLADCAKPLRWAWNHYEPYTYLNSNRILVGLDVELVRAILAEAKCGYKASEIPAKRALAMVESGETDMMAAASITPEREAYGYFSAPYRNERIVMFARRDSTASALTTLDQVFASHLRLAAGLGGYYGRDYARLQDAFNKARLLELNASLDDRMMLLKLGRADVVLEDEAAGVATARKLSIQDQIKVIGPPLSDEPVHLLLSRKSVSPDIVAAINAAIAKLQTSPEYTRILKAHTDLAPSSEFQ